MSFDLADRPLSATEARVLGTLMEKARTVPDSYPLTLNSLVIGCNQKTTRDPVMSVSDAEAQEALDELKRLSLVHENTGGRSARWLKRRLRQQTARVGRPLARPISTHRARARPPQRPVRWRVRPPVLSG